MLLTCCGVTWLINYSTCITLSHYIYGCHIELNGNTDIGKNMFQISCVDTQSGEVCADSVVTDVRLNVCYVQRLWSFPKQSPVRSTLSHNSQVTGGIQYTCKERLSLNNWYRDIWEFLTHIPCTL